MIFYVFTLILGIAVTGFGIQQFIADPGDAVRIWKEPHDLRQVAGAVSSMIVGAIVIIASILKLTNA